MHIDNYVGSLWTGASANESNLAYIRKVVTRHASFNK